MKRALTILCTILLLVGVAQADDDLRLTVKKLEYRISQLEGILDKRPKYWQSTVDYDPAVSGVFRADSGGQSASFGTITGDDVELIEISPATYDDVQDFVNQFGQRTKITGIDMSDVGDGTVAVSAGTAWCKTTSALNATGAFFDFAGGATDDVSGALTDLATNYIFLDYNGGSPQIVHDTTGALLAQYDHIVLGQVFRHGTHCHILNADETGLDIAHKTKLRFFQDGGARRVSGMVTASTGTRNLSVTAGAMWMGLTRVVSLSFDSSSVAQGTADATEAYMLHDADGGFSANDVEKRLDNTADATDTDVVAFIDSGQLRLKDDIFVNGNTYDLYDSWDAWYTDDSGTTWTHVEGVTQVDNLQYNDITTGLETLLNSQRFAVHWLYLDIEGTHLHMVYGQGDYTASEAEEVGVPAVLPNIASVFGILIAKIVVQKSTDTLIITYPWTSAFTSSLATDHGNLVGLLDDDHTQYLLVAGSRPMTGDLDMDSSYQVKSLQAPAALGEAIRQTANVTETNLNALTGSGETALHSHAVASGVARIETGTYTGDGTTEQVVTMTAGWTPKFLILHIKDPGEGVSAQVWWRSDQHSANDAISLGTTSQHDNRVTAFGAGSFTVDDDGSDGHPNKNGVVYAYIAWG
jgi:hypothetical protein